MINKNFYRKTNDKKILHKVGKQWKVVSVALLMAIGGAAVATHANANADVNDQPYAANQAQFAQKPASAKPQQQSVSSASVSYYPEASGSAAMYFDKVASDNAVAAKNYNTVNSYVQSLNNEYNPQVQSFSAKSASASDAAKKDAKLASSYSVVNNNPATAKAINSLAAKNHYINPQLYQATVQDNEQAYSSAVSNASDDVKANHDVASLVNKLESTDLSAASLNASESSVVAASNSIAASDNLASVEAYYGYGDTTAASYVNISKKLRADVNGLLAAGNPVGNGANYGLLTETGADAHAGNYNTDADKAALTSAIKSAASDATNRYKLAYSAALNGTVDDLASFADSSANSSYVSKTYYTAGEPLNINGDNDVTHEFNGAISEAANEEFAAVLESAATSLDNHYQPQYANNLALSQASSGAIASAKAASLSASYAYDFASANNSIVDNISLAVGDNSKDAKASFASKYLNVDSLGVELDLLEPKTPKYAPNGVINNVDVYTGALNDIFYQPNYKEGPLVATLLRDNVLGNLVNNETNVSTIKTHLMSINAQNLKEHHSNLNSTNVTDINDALNGLVNNVDNYNVINGYAGEGNTPFNYSPVTTNVKYGPTQNYSAGVAALLSAGVDFDALEAESGAINNVASAANSASASNVRVSGYHASAAEALDNDLTAANSSANSAEGSAVNASDAYSAANDEDVTLASYFATSYSNEGNNESASASSASSALNTFFKNMAQNDEFNSADDAYAGAEAAAANDKKMGVSFSKVVFNNSPHFLDVLKNAKLHSSYDFGSNGDKIIGTASKGDRLTVLGVNFSRNGLIHGATHYLVYDNNTKKTGFFTGQYLGNKAYSKAAYLDAKFNTNNVNVSVKTLKPVNVMDNLNGGKVVKTLPAGTVVNNVTIVSDNPSNDAMGFTKVETSDYNFFTANTDYVELDSVVPKNNNNVPNNYAFNLSNVNLAKAYNNNSQY